MSRKIIPQQRTWPVLSGVLLGLSFPPFNLHFLAWFCLIPLWLSIEPLDSTERRSFFVRGLTAGWVGNLIIYFWLWKTFHAADINFITTLSAWVALALVQGLYVGVFALAVSFFPKNAARPWLAALMWLLLDQVKAVVLTGFPWGLLAHTQAYNLPIAQLASYAGAGGVTFLLVLFGSSLALARQHRVNFVVVCALVIVVFGWGKRLLATIPDSGQSCLKVGLLQGNIDQYAKWDDRFEAEVRGSYESLALEAAASQPDVIIWPESAIPGWYPNQEKYEKWVRELVVKTKTFNLIGSVTSHDDKEYNSAFLLRPDGSIAARYDKQHLVPFGEYIPFGGFLKAWIPYLGQLGTFHAGSKAVPFDVNGTKLSPNICYEAIFPDLVARSVRGEGDIIVNITNDGWFLDTGAPEQHYIANIFRAIETRKPVIRVANTGITAVIDPMGRETLRSSMLTSGVFVTAVCYTPAHVTGIKKPN